VTKKYAELMPQPANMKEQRVPSLSEVEVGGTPLPVILDAVQNGNCNSEADAKVSYDIAYNLMLKLANF